MATQLSYVLHATCTAATCSFVLVPCNSYPIACCMFRCHTGCDKYFVTAVILHAACTDVILYACYMYLVTAVILHATSTAVILHATSTAVILHATSTAVIYTAATYMHLVSEGHVTDLRRSRALEIAGT